MMESLPPPPMQTPSTFTVTIPLPLAEAGKKVREALSAQQFGVITEINIQAKLQEKLGVHHPPHTILGACNPKLAYQALQDNIDVALVLPCNVVLREEGGKTIVTALLPSVVLERFSGNGVRESAAAAEANMSKVFEFLTSFHP